MSQKVETSEIPSLLEKYDKAKDELGKLRLENAQLRQRRTKLDARRASKVNPGSESQVLPPVVKDSRLPVACGAKCKPYDRHCSSCGEPNEHFKDETKCVDCGFHLGAKEHVNLIPACPSCGSKKGAIAV